MEHDSIDAKFRGLKAELVDGRLKELPGETHYFLSHERRYLSDLETVLRLYQQGEILEVGAYPFFFTAIGSGIGFVYELWLIASGGFAVRSPCPE